PLPCLRLRGGGCSKTVSSPLIRRVVAKLAGAGEAMTLTEAKARGRIQKNCNMSVPVLDESYEKDTAKRGGLAVSIVPAAASRFTALASPSARRRPGRGRGR